MKPTFVVGAGTVPAIFLMICCSSCSKGIISFFDKRSEATYVHTERGNLSAFISRNNKPVTVVFESGLGDGALIWAQNGISREIGKKANVILYDRAGYEKSYEPLSKRDVPALTDDLKKIIDSLVPPGNRLILVAHSLGGYIIRDYAIKNPSKISALLFIDPSHECDNNPSEQEERKISSLMKLLKGKNSGAFIESRELKEDAEYMQQLGALPDVPVTVLTAMKTDLENGAADRKKRFNCHQSLSELVKNFRHIPVPGSGHYIQKEKPGLVLAELNRLIKLISL